MPASKSRFASIREPRLRFALSLLAAAFFALFCLAPLSAQNAATTVNVDAGTINVNSLPNGAIDPRIYGIGMISVSGDDCNADTANLEALNSPTHRWGGDLTSTYNWQTDSWNLSNDWYWELYTIGSGNGACVDEFITKTQAAGVGTEPIITVPMLPWISNSTSAAKYKMSFPVSVYPGQTGADPYNSEAGNGVLASTGKNIVNNPSDDYVANSADIQKQWVQHLVTKFGGAEASAGVKYYMLDNEPDIWDGTHRDVHPDYPNYDEMWDDIQAYAGAIKEADPSAIVIGPEEPMWAWMWVSEKDMKGGRGTGSDYANHGNMYWYPYLLSKLAAYKQANGVNLIDILSVHCYDDQSSNPNKATRLLWDNTYTDSGGSWFNVVGGGVVDYIPTMRNWVKFAFPNGDGPLVGCTEYYSFGGSDMSSMSGATTEADVLGIFGAYGFSFGNFWTLPAKPTFLAMQIYRNYDSKNSTFGDTSVTDTVTQPDNLSSFAAVRKSDGALTVMVINKQTGATPVTINLANFSNGGTAKAYQISSASQTSINSLGSKTITNNAISDSLPGPSVTLYVIPAVTVAPTTPTNLTAAGGNGLVTLNWTAGTGATSYNVYRGTTVGGESTTPIATGVTAVTYVDSTVTNGQTYYYTVRAVNSIGTSDASNEASATPESSYPLFTATATASPNPATQNASTTLTVKVTCTQNSLTGGSVSIVVLDPSGNAAQTTPETSQSFTNGQVQTYSPAITPTVVGTYTVQVNVYGSSGQLFSSIPFAGTFTVNAAPAAADPAFTITGSANPTSISASGSTTITATFTNTGGDLVNGNLHLQVYNGSTAIGGIAPNYNANNIAAGASQTLTFTWTPSVVSSSNPAVFSTSGTYNIIGMVFNNGYSKEYTQTTIGTITITGTGSGGGGDPAFTITGSANPTSISASGSSTITAKFTNTGGDLVNGNLQLQVYNGSTAIGGIAPNYNANNIAAGASQTLTFTWTPSVVSSSNPAVFSTSGTYNIIGMVFNNGYSKEYTQTTIGTITITAASTTPPAGPTGLTATAGNDTVGLSWTASSGATSYNIYRSTTSGGEGTTPYATSTTASYTDNNVANGTKYYYTVAGVNAGGTGTQSNEASATPTGSGTGFVATAIPNTQTIAPSASATVQFSVTNSGTIAFPNSSVEIQILDSTGKAVSSQIYPGQDFEVGGAAQNYVYYWTPSGLAPPVTALGTYTIQISVLDKTQNIQYQNQNAGTIILANVAVTAPTFSQTTTVSVNPVQVGSPTDITTNVTDTSSTVGLTNGVVTIDLIPTGGSVANAVYSEACNGMSFTAGSSSSSNTLTCAISWDVASTVAPGTYAVGVEVQDADLQNTYYWSPVAATVTVIAAVPVPTAPTGLTATPADKQVTLNWTAPTGTTGTITYDIYRGTTKGGEGSTPVASGVTATTWTNLGLTDGQIYYFKVAAVNSASVVGPQSNEASATPNPAAPNPPTGLTATAGDATVTLSWTAPTGTTGTITYNVFRGTSAGAESTTPIVTGLSGLSYTNTGLTNGTTYYYYVKSVSGTAASTASNEASATPRRATTPTFTLSATTPASIKSGSSATSTVTVSTTNGYVGSVTLGCALTASPANATSIPTCSAASSAVTLTSGVTTGTATVTITTASLFGELSKPKNGGDSRGWAGCAVLAFLIFLRIPSRRRAWRAMLSVLALMAALGSLSACGGNISHSGANGATSSGSYTFTVTGTGNPAVTPAPTTTFIVTVK